MKTSNEWQEIAERHNKQNCGKGNVVAEFFLQVFVALSEITAKLDELEKRVNNPYSNQ